MQRHANRGFPLILALSLACVSCSVGSFEPKQRPAGVPSRAVWAGGADGGSYVRCDIDTTHDVNPCTVWNDFTGGIVEQGSYRLLREHRAATRQELDFRWADRGGRIGLKDNKVLENLAIRHP